MQMSKQLKIEQPLMSKIWFFLLINTKSGGGWGKCYLELKKQEFSFQYKKQKIINVRFIDLFDKERKQSELRSAKQLQKDKQNDVRIIICGGDGTIVWGIQETSKAGLNLQQLSFASLPIGTGNDFSRTIGWGTHPLKFKQGDILPLKKRLIEWLSSQIVPYDVWYVQISLYEKGQIYVVKNKQDFLLEKKEYKTAFVNYLGMGIDGRVSYNFQKNRSAYKLINLAIYGCLGFLYLCKKIPSLSHQIQLFQQKSLKQPQVQQQSPASVMKQVNLDDSMVDYFDKNQFSLQSRKITLKPGYHGIVCLNSISYMAGAINIWRTTKVGCREKGVKFQEQKVSDGKIEFIGYKNQLSLGLEQIFHSGAKIAQGQGPFVIKFRQESLQHFNYFQVDGEGLKIKGIKEINIKRHQGLPSSRIKVMVRKPN